MSLSTSPVTAPPAAAPRSRAGAAWRAGGATLAVLSLAASLLSTWSWLARRTEAQQQTYRQPVTGVELQVDGELTVDVGAAGEVALERRLTWSAGRPEITEHWDGTVLRVVARCVNPRRLPGCAVDYRVRIPAGVAVTAHTFAGGITAREVTGDLDLTATAGGIELTGTRGALRLRVDSGAVRTRALRSPTVSLLGDSGDVELRFADVPRVLRVETRTGDISVEVPGNDPYAVVAETDSGTRAVDVTRDTTAPRSVTATTRSGDIRLRYSGP